MRSIILIIGKDIRINKPFLNYILNKYEEKFKLLDDIKFIEKNDKNLSSIIENLSFKYENIFIFASNEAYHLVARLIATLTNDILKTKNNSETLAPSLAKSVVENSFLIELNKSKINLLKTDPLKKLPNFLIKPQSDSINFYIFGYDLKNLKSNFNQILNKFDIALNLTQYSEKIIKIEATKKKFGDIDGFFKTIDEIFNHRIIKDENLVEFIVKKLKENRAKVSIAESFTAGLIASKIGEISGASDVFDGSLVTYSNEIKNIWLDVDRQILDTNGAVSLECVNAMLDGVLKNSGASFAMATSGVAGPSGGTKELPVGTVFVGVKNSGGKKIIRKYYLQGDRNYIREEGANIAFSMLLELCASLFFASKQH